MKIVGVVAEYNPFHKGHMYHLSKIRSDFRPDGIICAMSGNFVQRGEPAIFDKWARARMALGGGADLVFEIPTCFASSTAEIFAEAAVKLLNSTGLVNCLSFGIEEYKIEELHTVSEILAWEPDSFKSLIKKHLKEGLSFPSAREKALLELLSGKLPQDNLNHISELLKKPNFILAVEYLKALKKYRMNMEILPVKREGAGYHEKDLHKKYPSASAIREYLKKNGGGEISHFLASAVPPHCAEIIKSEIERGKGPVFLENFEILMLGLLRRSLDEELRSFFDITEGLENRIKQAAKKATDLNELIGEIKSKRYPETRIQRILIHVLLNIEKELVASRTPNYLRVLGFSKRGLEILREIKKRSELPIIVRAAEYKKLTGSARRMFEIDLLASDLYSLVLPSKGMRRGGRDFSTEVIRPL